MRFRSSCWTTYWSTNEATWQMSEKSSEESPKPGIRRANGAGWARSPGTSAAARPASSTSTRSTVSGSLA